MGRIGHKRHALKELFFVVALLVERRSVVLHGVDIDIKLQIRDVARGALFWPCVEAIILT